MNERPYAIPVILAIAGVALAVAYYHLFGFTGYLLSGIILGGFAVLFLYLILSKKQGENLLDEEEDTSESDNGDKARKLSQAISSPATTYDELERQYHEALLTIQESKKQLIAQDKMASIGILTAGIAHEIKNPLNFINNFSEMTVEMLNELKSEIRKIENLPEDIRESVEGIIEDIDSNCSKINEHGKRAESIIQNMLLQSRSNKSEKSLTNINQLLEEYLNLAYHGMRAINNQFNAKIEKDLSQDMPEVMVSRQTIGRVLLNIINNGLYAANDKRDKMSDSIQAAQFMPTLKITTEYDNNNDYVIIKIKDNGEGIPNDLKEKIFEPFFTTKPIGQGTGLGLHICHEIIVDEHNGQLEINTEPGNHTEFVIKLPCKSD